MAHKILFLWLILKLALVWYRQTKAYGWRGFIGKKIIIFLPFQMPSIWSLQTWYWVACDVRLGKATLPDACQNGIYGNIGTSLKPWIPWNIHSTSICRPTVGLYVKKICTSRYVFVFSIKYMYAKPLFLLRMFLKTNE